MFSPGIHLPFWFLFLWECHGLFFGSFKVFLDAGQDGRPGEKGMTQDDMVGKHHRLNGHEFEQASGDGKRQGSLVAAVLGVTKSWTQLSDWTAAERFSLCFVFFLHLCAADVPWGGFPCIQLSWLFFCDFWTRGWMSLTVLHYPHPFLFKYCLCSTLPGLFFWDSKYINVFKTYLCDIFNINVFT